MTEAPGEEWRSKVEGKEFKDFNDTWIELMSIPQPEGVYVIAVTSRPHDPFILSVFLGRSPSAFRDWPWALSQNSNASWTRKLMPTVVVANLARYLKELNPWLWATISADPHWYVNRF